MLRKLGLWYGGLSSRGRVAVICAFAAAVLAVSGAAAYMVLVPGKVEVRYGTIVRDPVDGRVWEDNTKTAMVDPKDAPNFRVEYIDKLSPEHEKELAEEGAREEAERRELEESQGFESVSMLITGEETAAIQGMQEGIEEAGASVVTGMEMAAEIGAAKSSLVGYRNQVAGMAIPPQLEPIRQQTLQVFDMYISACDLYLEGIAKPDLTLMDQAGQLVKDANARLQSILGPLTP